MRVKSCRNFVSKIQNSYFSKHFFGLEKKLRSCCDSCSRYHFHTISKALARTSLRMQSSTMTRQFLSWNWIRSDIRQNALQESKCEQVRPEHNFRVIYCSKSNAKLPILDVGLNSNVSTSSSKMIQSSDTKAIGKVQLSHPNLRTVCCLRILTSYKQGNLFKCIKCLHRQNVTT